MRVAYFLVFILLTEDERKSINFLTDSICDFVAVGLYTQYHIHKHTLPMQKLTYYRGKEKLVAALSCLFVK